jgi:carotenoid cleavage dioxygenase-like enzyme
MATDSEYLQGVLAPVHDELTLTKLPVQGEIPRGLRGTYLRNGPNPAFPPLGAYHLWDGDGMLHAIRFDDDGVSYRNRWVRTPGFVLEHELGRAVFGGLKNLVAPPAEYADKHGFMKNVANTNIVRHAGHYLALWEGGQPTELTAELETVGLDDFAGVLVGPMTAHPKIDPIDGEMHFFGYSMGKPHLRYHVADAAGKLVRSLDIEIPNPVMMHDFVVSRDHVVFFDSPMVFDLQSLAAGGPMMRWKPELGTRVGVMRRGAEASAPNWIEIESCYVFHFLNAWSEGDVVHVLGASTPWVVVDYEYDRPPQGVDANSYLCRFTIDTAKRTCRQERVGDIPGEFCKIPDAVAGLESRFGYLASFSTGVAKGAAFDSLTQYDLETGRETCRGFGPNKIVGEPCFAPEPGGRAENDGWVVAYVHEADGSASELVVLDARDFAAEPVARVLLPRRVPLGFHGNWMTL